MEMHEASVEGVVRQEIVSPGSKSERLDFVLQTSSGTYTLRRQGSSVFVDQGLAPLIGHSIRAQGLLADKLLILKSWEVID